MAAMKCATCKTRIDGSGVYHRPNDHRAVCAACLLEYGGNSLSERLAKIIGDLFESSQSKDRSTAKGRASSYVYGEPEWNLDSGSDADADSDRHSDYGHDD